ncbi:CpaF family protein [Candidatus Omnitrophota bacterium]
MEKRELKKILRDRLFSVYDRLRHNKFSKKELLPAIDQLFELMQTQQDLIITPEEKKVVTSELINDLMAWGPLQPLMEDPDITEIFVNGASKIYIEKDGRNIISDIRFDDEDHLRYIIERMIRPTRRRLDESSPYVDFSLEDGSRVNIIIPPLSVIGPTVTIRKFLKNIQNLDDLVRMDTLGRNMADFLLCCVKAKVNMVFSGATGVGKTTTLEVLSSYIESTERIVTIEDARELHLRQDHVISLLTRAPNIEGKGEIAIRDLFRNTLRMRPSRIILGEIRGKEALDFLQSLNSGHRGSLAVLHASSPEDATSRLETMVFYAGVNIPIWVVRKQISSGVDVIVQQEQLVDGTRKVIRISEIRGIDQENNIVIKDLFYFRQKDIDSSGKVTGEFKATGAVPQFMDRFDRMGVNLSKDVFKPE